MTLVVSKNGENSFLSEFSRKYTLEHVDYYWDVYRYADSVQPYLIIDEYANARAESVA